MFKRYKKTNWLLDRSLPGYNGGYGGYRTHVPYPVSDRSGNRFLFCLSKNILLNFKDIKKSLARSVANWVRMVGTVGTVHGYGTWVRWVRWYGR